MMSPAQRVRYFRFWQAAWARHWSGVVGGEPVPRAGRPPSEFRDEVVRLAGQIAGCRNEALKPDHLRYACHFIALGDVTSSSSLTNKQQDLVIAVFQRLAESGHELAGQMRMDEREVELDRRHYGAAVAAQADGWRTPWEATRPDADRKRVITSIERSGYPLPAVEQIARVVFRTSQWRSLPTPTLVKLMMTVKARAKAKARKEATATAPP